VFRVDVYSETAQLVGALKTQAGIQLAVNARPEPESDRVDPDHVQDVECVDERSDDHHHAPIGIRGLQCAVIAPARLVLDFEIPRADDAVHFVPLDRERSHIVGLVRQRALIKRLDFTDDPIAVAQRDGIGLLSGQRSRRAACGETSGGDEAHAPKHACPRE
jgi:hypothetical protein